MNLDDALQSYDALEAYVQISESNREEVNAYLLEQLSSFGGQLTEPLDDGYLSCIKVLADHTQPQEESIGKTVSVFQNLFLQEKHDFQQVRTYANLLEALHRNKIETFFDPYIEMEKTVQDRVQRGAPCHDLTSKQPCQNLLNTVSEWVLHGDVELLNESCKKAPNLTSLAIIELLEGTYYDPDVYQQLEALPAEIRLAVIQTALRLEKNKIYEEEIPHFKLQPAEQYQLLKTMVDRNPIAFENFSNTVTLSPEQDFELAKLLIDKRPDYFFKSQFKKEFSNDQKRELGKKLPMRFFDPKSFDYKKENIAYFEFTKDDLIEINKKSARETGLWLPKSIYTPTEPEKRELALLSARYAPTYQFVGNLSNYELDQDTRFEIAKILCDRGEAGVYKSISAFDLTQPQRFEIAQKQMKWGLGEFLKTVDGYQFDAHYMGRALLSAINQDACVTYQLISREKFPKINDLTWEDFEQLCKNKSLDQWTQVTILYPRETLDIEMVTLNDSPSVLPENISSPLHASHEQVAAMPNEIRERRAVGLKMMQHALDTSGKQATPEFVEWLNSSLANVYHYQVPQMEALAYRALQRAVLSDPTPPLTNSIPELIAWSLADKPNGQDQMHLQKLISATQNPRAWKDVHLHKAWASALNALSLLDIPVESKVNLVLYAWNSNARLENLNSLGLIAGLVSGPRMLELEQDFKTTPISEVLTNTVDEVVGLPIHSQQEKFTQTFGSTRNPAAIMQYAASLKANSYIFEDNKEALHLYFQSVLDGTFHDVRYDTNENPHLKEVFENREELKQAWIAGGPVMGLNEVLKDSQASETAAFSVPVFLQQVLKDKHLPEEQMGQLKSILEQPDPRAQSALLNKLGKKAAVAAKKKQPDANQLEAQYLLGKLALGLVNEGSVKQVTSRLRNLLKIKETDPFHGDLELIATELLNPNRAVVNEEDLCIIDTDDPIEILLAGTDVSGSCQNVTFDANYSQGLLGYLLNGQVRMIEIKKSNDPNEPILGRALLRILWDEDNKKPVLMLERMYPATVTPRQQAGIIEYAKKRAAALKLDLISVEIGEGEKYSGTVVSKGGRAPREYCDSSNADNHVAEDSKYELADSHYLAPGVATT